MNWTASDRKLPDWAKDNAGAFVRAMKAEIAALQAEYMADLESVYGMSPVVYRPIIDNVRLLIATHAPSWQQSYPATPNTAPIPRERALVVQP